MVPQDLDGLSPVLISTSRDFARDISNHILTFVGSIAFVTFVSALFILNLETYLNPHLRLLNPQSFSGVWLYGPELFLGLVILILSSLGILFRSFDSTKLRWTMFGLALLAFAYFAYILRAYILGLFIDEFPIGIGMVFMIIGTFRNTFSNRETQA